MASNEQRVYTFESVSFATADRVWEVSSVVFVLQENAIPTVRLTLDPAHWLGDPLEPATSASLGKLITWHDEIQQKAQDKVRASFRMEIYTTGESDPEIIELNDWVITSAGLAGVRATGAFALEVEIQHPICLCNYTGIGLNSFITSPKEIDTITDMVGTLTDALNKYADAKLNITKLGESGCGGTNEASAASESDIQAIITDYQGKLRTAATTLTNSLEWAPGLFNAVCSYSSWPLINNCFLTYNKQLAAVMADYIYKNPDANVWQILSAYIAPEWMITIVPTFWDEKLKMTPVTPWAEPTLTIQDTDISNINLPGVDPAPLAGVMINYQVPAQGIDNTALSKSDPGADAELDTASMIFIPKGKPSGTIVTLAAPSWLNNLINRLGGAAGNSSSPGNAEGKGQVTTGANSSFDQEVKNEDPKAYQKHFDEYRGAIFYYAAAAFYTLFRQSMEIGLTTRLLLTAPGSELEGNWVVPGQVCQLEIAQTELDLPQSGEVFVEFYVTNVLHIIDCQNNDAHTEINGRYVRPEGGFENVAADGTCNPLYT